MWTIDQLADLITEDPDWTLCEAAAETYLNAFNKSKVLIPWGDGDATLAQLPPDEKLDIIRRIQAVVDPALGRYEQYFVRQVANGYLDTGKIEEDAERLNNTIKLFIKLSRKATWEGSKNILDYPNWRKLELQVREHEDKHIDYDAAQDSEVLFTKSYANNALSLLLGGQPEVTTYWFRSLASPEAACKYGKGTMWCTSSDPGPRNAPAYDQHYFHTYKEDGVYIVEVKTPAQPRRPVLQMSGAQWMNQEDVPIIKVGARLQDFISSMLQAPAVAQKILPATLEVLQGVAETGLTPV